MQSPLHGPDPPSLIQVKWSNWLSSLNVLCWFDQEFYHLEVVDHHGWSIAVLKGPQRQMQTIESGSSANYKAWRCHHTWVVNSNSEQGLHWFVCGMNCPVTSFKGWVWEPLSLRNSFASLCPHSNTTDLPPCMGFLGSLGGWSYVDPSRHTHWHTHLLQEHPICPLPHSHQEYEIPI